VTIFAARLRVRLLGIETPETKKRRCKDGVLYMLDQDTASICGRGDKYAAK
jgi:hypothetical protein